MKARSSLALAHQHQQMIGKGEGEQQSLGAKAAWNVERQHLELG
jgi:hypothetical protein